MPSRIEFTKDFKKRLLTRIKALRAEGWTLKEIAKELNISTTSVSILVREAGLPKVSPIKLSPERIKYLNDAAKVYGYKNYASILNKDIKSFVGSYATRRELNIPIGAGSVSQFNPDQYIKEFGGVAELNKATEYYTKGKEKNFKDLIGPKYKAMRVDIFNNLRRNNKKFIDPDISRVAIRKPVPYQEIKDFIADYKKKNNGRLPNGEEVARGTGFARQGEIRRGLAQGLFKLSKKASPTGAHEGAEKRALMQTKTPKTTDIPILRTRHGGTYNPKTNPYTHIIWPDKKIGNKTYREAFIDDLKLKFKYPIQSLEAKEAGV